MSGPLLVFDFDGVLVDGMAEYWWAARQAALRLDPSLQLPADIPPAFRRLRPLIHKGWEMVLVAAEPAILTSADNRVSASDYQAALAPALRRHGWSERLLQDSLEQVRAEALAQDRRTWLDRHRFYPGIVPRLRQLAGEGADWGVLTTKGGAFAREILAAAGLEPLFVHGHEQGSKPQVLLRLQAMDRPLWFLEDRRPTLEAVRASEGLETVRCYLVSWGYLAPSDHEGLQAQGIRWLMPQRFASPLADWP